MKRALVTGGSGALGEAICRKLAAAGRHVYVHANNGVDRAARIASEITATGGSASVVVFDVADAQAVETALGPLASPETRTAIRRAESRPQALTLLFMAPEFQRR